MPYTLSQEATGGRVPTNQEIKLSKRKTCVSDGLPRRLWDIDSCASDLLKRPIKEWRKQDKRERKPSKVIPGSVSWRVTSIWSWRILWYKWLQSCPNLRQGSWLAYSQASVRINCISQCSGGWGLGDKNSWALGSLALDKAPPVAESSLLKGCRCWLLEAKALWSQEVRARTHTKNGERGYNTTNWDTGNGRSKTGNKISLGWWWRETQKQQLCKQFRLPQWIRRPADNYSRR